MIVLNDEERTLVRQSWSLAALDTKLAAQLFYGRLFDQRPDLRAMFGTDMTLQGRKLMDTINFVVDNLDKPDVLEKPVRELGLRHLGYGVAHEDYNDVGSALLWTFGHLMGEKFTDDVKNAWLSVYSQISDQMIRAHA